MSHARRMMQQALQESLDRRDNGGPAGLGVQGDVNGRDEFAEYRDAEVYPSGHFTGEPLEEPPVSVWAAGQLQRAVSL